MAVTMGPKPEEEHCLVQTSLQVKAQGGRKQVCLTVNPPQAQVHVQLQEETASGFTTPVDEPSTAESPTSRGEPSRAAALSWGCASSSCTNASAEGPRVVSTGETSPGEQPTAISAVMAQRMVETTTRSGQGMDWTVFMTHGSSVGTKWFRHFLVICQRLFINGFLAEVMPNLECVNAIV